MIEINLIPDVKVEYLKARSQRRMVISASIVLAIASAVIVALLASYAFGVQTIAKGIIGGTIDSESKKLLEIQDLSKTLTIQSQLEQLDSQHNNKSVSSRLFDIISTTVPTGKNAVVISRLSLDTNEKKIEIEGQAENGYEALEVFKKTIAQTKFEYSTEGEAQPAVNIASSLSDGERRLGEDSDGKQTLRFNMSFTYPEQLFSPESRDGRVVAPNRQNATDSAKGVPNSLFSGNASGSN